MSEDLFGSIIDPEDVIDAAVATLRLWLPEYIAERERKLGLPKGIIPRPPTAESYHGGTDFESWIGADAPEVMVTCKPNGAPEVSATAGYTQGFELQVGCLHIGTGSTLALRAEDEARIVASRLGGAVMLLVQQPNLGGLAERLRMTVSPEVSFPDPERRAIQQCITGFEVWASSVIEEAAGPVGATPKEAPGYEGPEEPWGALPVVTKSTTSVVGEPTETPL